MDFILLIMISSGKYLSYLENKCWQGVGKKETLYTVGGMHSFYRKKWRFLKTLKIVLLYDPAISLPGIYPEVVISAFPYPLQHYSQ